MDRINSFKEKFVEKGLTFDDVLLLPAHSEVLPRDVNTSTKLTETITINVPIISAAMFLSSDWSNTALCMTT